MIFLLADTQIQWEGMVEDISNLLNTGEVPNLFDGSDLAQIGENVRARAKQAGMDGTCHPYPQTRGCEETARVSHLNTKY